MPAPRHDAHIHITPAGDAGATNLADYVATRAAAGIDIAAIVTPSTMGWDNDVSFAAAATDPERFRVIARVDLLAPDAVATTTAVLARGATGVRVTLMGETDIGWLDDGTIDDAANVLAQHRAVVEFHAEPEQLGAVARFAQRFPDATILVDHLGRPDPTTGADSASFREFLALAPLDNVYAKTANASFFSRTGRPYTDLVPFYERALASFGASRLLWASDWPLCVRDDPFEATIDPLDAVLGGDANADADLVLRGNFERILGGGR